MHDNLQKEKETMHASFDITKVVNKDGKYTTIPDTKYNVRDVFGLDVDWEVPGFKDPDNQNVPDIDKTYHFDFETTMAYKINKKWKCSMNFVYNTGQPATLATTMHEGLTGIPMPVYTSRNNLRMPDYHRMDISFSKEFLTRRKKHPATISFGAFNVYSRIKPFYVSLDNFKSFGGKDDLGYTIGYESKYKSGTLFGIMPFINYSVKF